jgi:hypothetical protein
MIKGHLDQERANVRSTQARIPTNIVTPPSASATSNDDAETADKVSPTITEPPALKSDYIYTSCQPVTGQIYTGPTGRFLLPSSAGNSYMLVVYVYDANAILAEPMKTHSGADHLAAYKRIHATLTQHGLKPQLQKLDNKEADATLQQFMREQDINFQLMPPYVHCRKAAERAIWNFKNHFIAGLCCTDPDFPLHLWDKLLPQALTMLNLLRGSRINLRLSAHAQIYGAFDFN